MPQADRVDAPYTPTHEIAYCMGLIVGEGCFSGDASPALIVALHSSDPWAFAALTPRLRRNVVRPILICRWSNQTGVGTQKLAASRGSALPGPLASAEPQARAVRGVAGSVRRVLRETEAGFAPKRPRFVPRQTVTDGSHTARGGGATTLGAWAWRCARSGRRSSSGG